MRLTQRLRELRSALGVSQRTIAEYLGVTNQTYSNYENGAREPSNEVIVKLAGYFGVTTDYLLGHSDFLNIENAPAEAGEATGLLAEAVSSIGRLTEANQKVVLSLVESLIEQQGQ